MTLSRNNQSKRKAIGPFSFSSSRDYVDVSVSVSDQMWVIYYSKDAIKEEYRSNEWTHLMASFCCNESFQVKGCGFHLIYSEI